MPREAVWLHSSPGQAATVSRAVLACGNWDSSVENWYLHGYNPADLVPAPPAHNLLWGYFHVSNVYTCFHLAAIISSPVDKPGHKRSEFFLHPALWHKDTDIRSWGSEHISSSPISSSPYFCNLALIWIELEFALLNCKGYECKGKVINTGGRWMQP